MSFGKMLFYDWAGANELMFKSINGPGSEIYNMAMMLVSRISDYKLFYHYLFMLFCFGLLDFALRKIKGKGGANHCLVAWFGVLLVFASAYFIDFAAVRIIEKQTAYPRPYVAMGPEDVTILEYREDRSMDYRSFPSMHVAFVTMLLTAMWPVLSSGMRKVGFAAVLVVGWSRIAVGMNFPADVLYAMLLSVFITFMVRWFLYLQLLRVNLKC